MPVDIYTDGACSGNPGPGGWGALLICDDISKEICGGEPDTTTNNRMELTAAIKALEFLTDHPFKVRLYTDSTYLCNGAKKCIGTPTPWIPDSNKDLWKRLRKASMPHTIEWNWVRAHSGNSGNERADILAKRGLAKSKKSMEK